jgi:hypothetical protein
MNRDGTVFAHVYLCPDLAEGIQFVGTGECAGGEGEQNQKKCAWFHEEVL